MLTQDKRCSVCQGDMFIDHVSEKDGVNVIYYACINPDCKERGKAYSATGQETQSQIRDKE